MQKNYRYYLINLFFDIFNCLLRPYTPEKTTIRVRIRNLHLIVYSEVQKVLSFLPQINEAKAYFIIDFPEEIKVYILSELKNSPLGIDLFSSDILSVNELLTKNSELFGIKPDKNKKYFDKKFQTGYRIIWDNSQTFKATCIKYNEYGQVADTYKLVVKVNIEIQRSIIIVNWPNIKKLLPITGIGMSRNVLARSYIDFFWIKKAIKKYFWLEDEI